jgi:hypothetical protein
LLYVVQVLGRVEEVVSKVDYLWKMRWETFRNYLLLWKKV